ncbi:probable tRNA (uracil-O(2)-)-methyltransferase [Anopheles bellator]|uniref:probable tRNA (uracil-O(2)-)-methyltransferase n=1 Tax=Anopheles bellator TaxID=139047 RepID=UPI0026496EF0|nr:probable tRNA (uracil-O(2)-)-methyltransferase [Anopheles bellator]
MFERIIGETDVQKNYGDNFWQAVDIYLFKAHVINKKLFGVKVISVSSYRNQSHASIDECFCDETRIEENLSQRGFEIFSETTEHVSVDRLSGSGNDGLIIVNRLLPKNINVFQPIDVICVIDFASRAVYLRGQQNDGTSTLFPSFPFVVQAKEAKLSIRCRSCDVAEERSTLWLRDVLMVRLVKWMVASTPRHGDSAPDTAVRSLSLIDDMEQYNHVFHELKQKYGSSMVKIWPECTDPQKFVFEDIAIAAYLIMLWRKERLGTNSPSLQSFVDIGCGNGLLVYILSCEGHRGYGIDLRKRKLWDLYPSGTVDLRVQTLVPSSASLFPDIDWIIGNHSDELSPWIPVIAARSSYTGRFFLLPCCAYEFDGSKYQRQNSNLSQYGDFLRYANEIAQVCGFDVDTDRLRIPSTKRTCIVGRTRNYPIEEYDVIDGNIQTFINERTMQATAMQKIADEWTANFKPRDSTEKVRNCTKIDRSIVDKIVAIVFEALLAKQGLVPELSNWNSGGTLMVGDLVKTIPSEHLTALKAECGGLQTLLKNNHQIFQVHNGAVQLRIPSKVSEIAGLSVPRRTKKVKNFQPINLKQKTCWFFKNHPNGCPLDERDCKFNHLS